MVVTADWSLQLTGLIWTYDGYYRLVKYQASETGEVTWRSRWDGLTKEVNMVLNVYTEEVNVVLNVHTEQVNMVLNVHTESVNMVLKVYTE